jgi:SpoVK/Ycf46/Vps4 family AAA+-type ATPase
MLLRCSRPAVIVAPERHAIDVAEAADRVALDAATAGLHTEPELAGRHGVVPPRAIVLFGPPGTGQTTFAADSGCGRLCTAGECL